MNCVTGFILTSESRDTGGRCELCYYLITDEGPALAVIENHKPLFFIRADTSPVFTERYERRSLELTDFSGNPADALYFQSLKDFFDAKRFLRQQGVTLYESDVRAEDRFLMERFIRGSVKVEGVPEKKGSLTVFRNPVLKRGGDYRPAFRTLSLDIETGRDGSVYSSAFHVKDKYNEIRKVFIRKDSPAEDTDKYSMQKGALDSNPPRSSGDGIKHDSWIEYCISEKHLIESVVDFIRNSDPDIIIGWHVIGFDLEFIERRGGYYRIPLRIGRGKRALRIEEKKSGIFSAFLEGRLVIDGPQSLRTAFYRFESFSLEHVSQELLGRGKDIAPEKDKVAEIERRFREDRKALAVYNLEDSVLVTEIFEKTAIIDQLVTRSLITGLAVDKVHMSVASFDFFMLPKIHRKGLVAPDTSDIRPGRPASGGYVFTSDPGLYHHVAVMDFKSLYPSIIRTFFIDPVSRLRSDEKSITTPAGIAFSSVNHILPEFLEQLMAKREDAKKRNDIYLSQAVKILMNSFYGVMGTPGCRFYNPELPEAITGTGQWILKTVSAYLRDSGYSVIYGDTDSVFLCLKQDEYRDPHRAGEMLAEKVNSYFISLLEEMFSVRSELEIEFEKHYLKFFLPPVRYSEEGARKRYAGLLDSGETEFKGLETVRSDWTELARDFQKELFRRFFAGEELPEWIKTFVENLKEGKYDSKLVYRKRLSRPPAEYIKNRPPHVRAALMLDPEGNKHIREVSYIVSAEGPVPLEMFSGSADYSHYIEKQIKPIADGVLFVTGVDFDSITGGRQLDLFQQEN